MQTDNKNNLNNRYSGGSCVVIGNGPSLTIDLLESLREKGMFSFAANGFCLFFDKVDFRPAAVCMSNYEAIENWSLSYPAETLKFFKSGWKEELKIDIDLANVYELPFSCSHELGQHDAPFIKDGHFSLDPFEINFCGDTVLLDFAIPMAVFMGFKDIYLCGVDCDYNKGYFDKRYPTATDKKFKGMINEDFSIAIPSYKYVMEVLNSWGKGLYKLTESSRLDFIPTRTLKELD